MFEKILKVLSDTAPKDEFSKLIEPTVKTRRLNRRKVVSGKVYQLHATRGWKCTGRVAK